MNLINYKKFFNLTSFLSLSLLLCLACKSRTFGENRASLKSVEFLGPAGQELFLTKEGEKLSVAFSCGGASYSLNQQDLIHELKAQLGYADSLTNYKYAISALAQMESQSLGSSVHPATQDIKARITLDRDEHAKQLSLFARSMEEIDGLFLKASLRSCFKESKKELERERRFERLEVYSALTAILDKNGISRDLPLVLTETTKKEPSEFVVPSAESMQGSEAEFYSVFNLLTTWRTQIKLEFEPKLSLKLGPAIFQDGKRLQEEPPKENKLLCILQKAIHENADSHKPQKQGISGLIDRLSFDNSYFAKANLSHFAVFTQDQSVGYQDTFTIMLRCGYRLNLSVFESSRSKGVFSQKSETGEMKSWKLNSASNEVRTIKYSDLVAVFPSEVKFKLYKE